VVCFQITGQRQKLLPLPRNGHREKLMKNSMANYLLSVKADEDLEDIAYYSLETWGEKQILELIFYSISIQDNSS